MNKAKRKGKAIPAPIPEAKPAPDWNDLIRKWEADMQRRHGDHWGTAPELEAVIEVDGKQVISLNGDCFSFKPGAIKKAMAASR